MKFAAVATIAAGLLVVCAQDSSTIRVTTRLVQVGVIVRDKNGPVTDLKKEDFKLFERGKERRIAAFSMAASGVPATGSGVKMPPNIFSNRFDRSAAAPSSVTILLIDGLNTLLMDQKLVRKSAIELLDTLKPQDRVALYTLGRELRVVHDFTNDFDELKATIAKTKGLVTGMDSAKTDAEKLEDGPGLSGAWAAQDATIALGAVQNRVTRTADALAAIGRHLAGVPGRKSLIWVSGSFPIGEGLSGGSVAKPRLPPPQATAGPVVGGIPRGTPTQDFGSSMPAMTIYRDELDKVTRALSEANIALYPVDARGLVAQSVERPTAPSAPEGIDTMRLLADRTGGKAFFNTNDLLAAMRGAIEDGRVSYTLSFYPDPNELDGKFHDLKVKVDRRSVDVRYRTGYAAVADDASGQRDAGEELRAAAMRPLDSTELGVSARADLVAGATPALRVAVSIDLSDVQVDQQGDRWVGKLDLYLLQIGVDGKVLDTSGVGIPINLTEARYRDAAREGLVVSKTLTPVVGVLQIRAVVLDGRSGKIGSLRMPMGPIVAAAQKRAEK
ncbi:MAG: VWA domain-containing protein [Bryobacteraceae bacterium]